MAFEDGDARRGEEDEEDEGGDEEGGLLEADGEVEETGVRQRPPAFGVCAPRRAHCVVVVVVVDDDFSMFALLFGNPLTKSY